MRKISRLNLPRKQATQNPLLQTRPPARMRPRTKTPRKKTPINRLKTTVPLSRLHRQSHALQSRQLFALRYRKPHRPPLQLRIQISNRLARNTCTEAACRKTVRGRNLVCALLRHTEIPRPRPSSAPCTRLDIVLDAISPSLIGGSPAHCIRSRRTREFLPTCKSCGAR